MSLTDPRASTLRRIKGSVFEERRLKRQSGKLEGNPVGAIDVTGLRRVARLESGDGCLGIGNPVVELAAHREQSDALAHQIRTAAHGFGQRSAQ